MITTLTIINDIPDSIYKRIKYFLTPNFPKYKVISHNGIDVMQIKYNYRNKKIPWKRILNLIQDENKLILCREDINLPSNLDINRYSSDLFMKELCKNAAVKYIKLNNFNPQKLKVVLLDKNAKYIDMLENVIMFASDIKVITNFPDMYFEQADKLMNDYGASVVIGDSINFVSCADILIAPDKITHRFDAKKNTIIFTSKKPTIPLNGTIYHSYKIKLPQQFINIMPDDLEPEYFLSALYDIYNIHMLSSIIPNYCVSDDKITSIF